MIAAALVASFTLTALDGRPVEFRTSDSPATVLAFVSTVCPVAADYADRLRALRDELAAKHVPVLMVYSNKTEPLADIRKHVRAVEWSFPVFRDDGNPVADAVGASYTPEVFVLDRTGKVRYSGAIDDAVNPARVKRRWAHDAVEAVLAGRDPEPARAKGFG
ncbi:MAG: redoxin domain-containing protein [Bryobacteraceae bacterium]